MKYESPNGCECSRQFRKSISAFSDFVSLLPQIQTSWDLSSVSLGFSIFSNLQQNMFVSGEWFMRLVQFQEWSVWGLYISSSCLEHNVQHCSPFLGPSTSTLPLLSLAGFFVLLLMNPTCSFKAAALLYLIEMKTRNRYVTRANAWEVSLCHQLAGRVWRAIVRRVAKCWIWLSN